MPFYISLSKENYLKWHLKNKKFGRAISEQNKIPPLIKKICVFNHPIMKINLMQRLHQAQEIHIHIQEGNQPI